MNGVFYHAVGVHDKFGAALMDVFESGNQDHSV